MPSCCAPDKARPNYFQDRLLVTLAILVIVLALSFAVPWIVPFRLAFFSYLKMMWWAILIGFVLGTFFVVRRILGIEVAQTGFTTLVTLVLFLGGGQLIGIGILGEYLGRIYDEVKQRPHYVVRRPRRP